jgi:hypothetical protein
VHVGERSCFDEGFGRIEHRELASQIELPCPTVLHLAAEVIDNLDVQGPGHGAPLEGARARLRAAADRGAAFLDTFRGQLGVEHRPVSDCLPTMNVGLISARSVIQQRILDPKGQTERREQGDAQHDHGNVHFTAATCNSLHHAWLRSKCVGTVGHESNDGFGMLSYSDVST